MKRYLMAVTFLTSAMLGVFAQARQWSDTTGKFQVEAEFVALKNGKVFLEKADGTVISVPLEKLSDADRKFVGTLTEKQDSAEKKNPPAGSPAAEAPAAATPAAGSMVDSADALALARHARDIFEANCYRCHGRDGATEGGFNFIMNLEKLTKTHVKPNDVAASLLYSRMASSDADQAMPPAGEKPRPTADDIAAIKKWIQAGAPTIPEEKSREFITNDQMFKYILADLRVTQERARKYNRYFTLTHLYNAGMSDDELQTYRHAFVKLLNSLSWNAEIVLPEAIDPASTIYRVDIRQLNWNDQIWTEIVNRNPYGLKLSGADATACYKESTSEMPAIRADWFVFAASRPPLYHSILALPESANELEQMLHVNVAADISQEQVSRAAFNRSGVSRNNRLIERHRLPYGSYWKSYDFGSNTGQKNLFEHPMGPGDSTELFRQDGGEIIFSLPNGLQGYMLVNGEGRRIDKGPAEIVSDPKSFDRAVMNGLSCMSCHFAGMIPKTDEIRSFVEANRKAFNDPESILVLYPPQKSLDSLFETDGKRFTAALEKIGIKAVTRTGEPVSTMSQRFEQELDMKLAASEFGFTPTQLDGWLEKSDTMARALGALRVPGGTVKRDSFVEVFLKAAVEFKLIATEPAISVPINPPTTRPTPLIAGSSSKRVPRTSGTLNKSAGVDSGTADAGALNTSAGEVQRFGDMGWGVESLAFSPDSKRLAVGKMDRALILFDVATGGRLSFLEKLESMQSVSALAFTPDGKKLIGGGRSGEILIWDVSPDGQLTRSGQFAGHTGEVSSIEVSRDGRFALSSGKDKRARYWEIDSGRELIPAIEFQRDAKSCRILTDGHRAIVTDGETLIQFDLGTGKTQRSFKLGRTVTEAVAISASGDRVFCSEGSKLQLWNTLTAVEIPVKMEEREIQWGGVFSPDGKLLFTGGSGKVSVWDTRTQQRIAALDLVGSGYVKTIACSQDGNFVAAIPSSAGQTLQVFRVPKH